MKESKSMASKKDKGAAAPETSECGNCAAPEGQNGVTLKTCPKCKLTYYCGRACQASHWKAGHKQFCVAPGDRKPQASQVPKMGDRVKRVDGGESSTAADDDGECPICFDPLATGALCTLHPASTPFTRDASRACASLA